MWFSRLCICYAIGSFTGVIMLGTLWGMAEFFNDWAFLTSSLTITDFYIPLVWGGIGGMLYMLPLPFEWFGRGALASFVPSIAYIVGSFNKVSEVNFAGFDISMLTRENSLFIIVAHIVVWGLISSYVVHNNRF